MPTKDTSPVLRPVASSPSPSPVSLASEPVLLDSPASETAAAPTSDELALYGPPKDFQKRADSLTWSMARTNLMCIAGVITWYVILALEVVPCGNTANGRCASLSWASHIIGPLFLWYFVDLLITAVHITFDNPKLLNHWLLGTMAFEFQEHHAEQWKITRWPAWYQATDSFPPVVGFGITCALVQYYAGVSMSGFVFYTAVFAMMGQHVHRYCHTPPPQRSRWMNALAKWRVIVTPQVHAKHHATLDCSYAQLNGLATPFIDFLRTRVPGFHELNSYWPAYLLTFYLSLPTIYYLLAIALPNAIARNPAIAAATASAAGAV